jgi:hypothetical protein
VVFLCSLSFVFALPSGLDGNGYVMDLPTVLLKRLVPLINVSVALLKGFVAVHGIPPQVLSTVLPFIDTSSLDALQGYVDGMMQDLAIQKRDEFQDELGSEGAGAVAVVDPSDQVVELALDEILVLVHKLESSDAGAGAAVVSPDWRPKHTGLTLATPLSGVKGGSQ